MLFKSNNFKSYILLLALAVLSASGCNIVKTESTAPTLLKTENATQAELMSEVNRFASVKSMRAKMDLKFEDNSFAQFGSKEVYRSADGEVVVQRPANIYMKVEAFKVDIAQMTSDGETFRVAILNAGSCGDCKKFVKGTNAADYSRLQKDLSSENGDMTGDVKKNVNAFANLRPQHFTDAMLVRPTDEQHFYVHSTTYQIEEDASQKKKSPIRVVNRGYYLLDEYARSDNDGLKITRRFWFDRVGGIRLARQQIFDSKGEIESDIVYGREGNLTETTDYQRLPLEIVVTRPQQKYSMRLKYQSPEAVTIGKTYPAAAFVLQNSWELEEVDLDKKLLEVTAQQQSRPGASSSLITRFQ